MTKEMEKNMSLIFDLQLFDDEPQSFSGNKKAEKINIFMGPQATVTSDIVDWTLEEGHSLSAVDAGAGNDTITVASGVRGLTIAGGTGKDYITIESGDRTAGNVYSIASGQGDDTIVGWSTAHDTLQIGSPIASSFMSNDGNDLTIKFASGSVKFVGIGATVASYVANNKINLLDNTGEESQLPVSYKMEDVLKANTIINTDRTPTGGSASTLRSGGVAGDTKLTIDGGAGADTIINEGSYVYIDGGAGADKITVQSKGVAANGETSNDTTGTSLVTINGGLGNDSITFIGKDTVSGHLLTYDPSTDGKDVIYGISSDDSISLTSGGYTQADAIKSKVSINHDGDVIIKFDGSNQITLKDGVTLLGGQTLNINNFTIKIPKKWVGTTSTSTTDKESFDTLYNGYTIEASAGNDQLTISGATIYADAGAGNDTISLTGGTNKIESDNSIVADVKSAVTVYGGAGNDIIDALSDTVGTAESPTLATHVYKFNPTDGADVIYGFNGNDTILIDDETATVSDAFVNGQYKLSITKGSKTGTIVLQDYKGTNRKLYLYIKTDEGGYASVPSGHFTGSLASADEGNAYYSIPNQTQLPEAGGDVTIDNRDNDLAIEGNKGNDTIVVNGSSNISVFGGAGNDYIYINQTVVSENTTYGSDITINGGEGDDYIQVETVTSGADNPTGADDKAKAKVYVFGATGGNDTIVGFSDFDQIQIDSNSTLINVSVSGNDAIVAVGKANTTKTTATITLKDFAGYPLSYEAPIRVATWDTVSGSAATLSAEQQYFLPKIYKQTTSPILVDTSSITLGSGHSNTVLPEGFTVSLGSKNDTIKNESVSNITLDGGSGDDSIVNGGENVSINAGAGNDIITLTSTAKNAVVVAGAGNDTIYGNIGGEHIYRFDGGQGKNYIVNFDPGSDIIQTENGTISSAEVTSDGVKILIEETGKSATTIYLKGTAETEGETDIKKYNLLEGGEIRVQTVGGAVSSTTVARKIIGTSGADNITNTLSSSHDPDGYSISAEGGNDVITNSGSNVSINAGAGNDTIYLTTDAEEDGATAENVTVYTGAGNDLVISNGRGHVYEWSGGVDSIYGFGEDDLLDIGTKTYSPSLTSDGFWIVIDGKKSILLRGAKIVDRPNNSTSATDYEALKPGTRISIANGTGTVFSQEIDPLYLGSDTAGQTIDGDITSKEITGTYVIKAGKLNDTINVAGDNISVNAGAGDDQITIKSGSNITVAAGKGTDTIVVKDAEAGHVFEFAKGDGKNIIYGINPNDTIKLTTANTSISSAVFQNNSSVEKIGENNNGYVLTLNDKSTTITLLGAETETKGKYNSLKDGSFFIQYSDGTGGEYNVPKILGYDSVSATEHTIAALGDDATDYTVVGDSIGNTLVNDGADNVVISLGAGNDEVTIASGKSNTINPGTGNDYVTLKSNGHVYEYNNGDGNDTILGWSSEDTLVINGATAISSMMSSLNNGNGVGQDFQLKIGSHNITFVNTDAGTQINLFHNGDSDIQYTLGSANTIKAEQLISFDIPSLVSGTSKADDLTNERAEYSIIAAGGHDTITNQNADNVTIDAGAGNDTIKVTSSQEVIIFAGDGNDTVEVAQSANKAYVDGGAGKDVIIIKNSITDVSIKGGAGDDLIIGNDLGNVYYYNKGDGKDSIYGYSVEDKIVLGDGLSIYSIGSDQNAVKTEVIDNGLVFTIWETVEGGAYTEAGKLTFKGQKISGRTEGSTDADNYTVISASSGTPFTFNINGNDITYEIPKSFAMKASGTTGGIYTNDVGQDNFLITGTKYVDTITNAGNYVTIDALAGNDTISNSGDDVSISGGAGNDIITITGGYNAQINAGEGDDTVGIASSAENATVEPGKGNDFIISNGQGGHVYKYTAGKDTIVGFSEEDSLVIDVAGAGYESEITSEGFLIKVRGSSSSTILLKGNLKDDVTPTLTSTASYELLEGGTILNIQTVNAAGDGYDPANATVASSLVGTNSGNIINNTKENYTIVAYGGADTITSNADSVYIDGGAGADQITVSGGSNVSIAPGADSDLITVQGNEGHLFLFNYGDGSNTILGFGENDSIRLATANLSIKAADFEVVDDKEYFVLTLLDNGSKIYMLEQDSNDNDGQGKSALRNTSFTIQYTGTGGTISSSEEYQIPNLFTLGKEEDKSTINATNGTINYNNAVIVDNVATVNNITVAAAEVSVSAGKGNDTILVQSSAEAATINAGGGDDLITLATGAAGHVIEYANGDGKDTILGWNEDNILSITSGVDPVASISSNGDYIIKVGSGYINFGSSTLAAATEIKIYKNGESTISPYTVPKSIQGGSGAETFESPAEGYTISAAGGNDTITNTYADVRIYAEAGKDTIETFGDRVYVDGGDGNDSINIAGGENVTVNAGKGVDFITIQAGVTAAVIDGEAGNDLIYSNGEGNLFKYTSGGGSDSIFGYSGDDSIQIGKNVTVESTEMTANGFIIRLNDDGTNRTLTLKGTRKEGATGNTADDFEDLKGGTIINISTVNGSNSLFDADAVVPFVKFVHSKNHTISNDDEAHTIIGSSAVDTIINTHAATNVTIQADAKDDIIINDADEVLIDAGDGHDTIYLGNTTVNSNIDPVSNDPLTIYNVDGSEYSAFTGSASNNSVRGGKGNDVIYGNGNHHTYVFYSYTDGQDVIYNYTDQDIIHFGTVQDYYGSNTSEKWTIDGMTDLVSTTYVNLENASYKDVILKVGFGTITLKSLEVGSEIHYSYIYTDENGDNPNTGYYTFEVKKEYVMNAVNNTVDNSLEENFIISKSASQADTILNHAANVTISAGGGDDTIQNWGATTSIIAGIGNDTVVNEDDGARVTIDAGEGDDSISNAANEVLIYGGAGADTVTISAGNNVSVFAGDGADLIQIADVVGIASIDAGKDNDVIELGTYNSASVSGGAGDDVIIRTDASNDGGNTYIYTAGDGNDTIEYKSGDALRLVLSSESTTVDGESTANGYIIKITTSDTKTSTIALTSDITKDADGNYITSSLAGATDLDIKISTNNGSTWNSNWRQGSGKEAIVSSPKNVFVVNNGTNTIAGGFATVGNEAEDYAILNVGSDAKYIENTGENVSIYAGAGADTIYNEGNTALIYGNDGDDSITIKNGAEDVSINAGAGNDIVTLDRAAARKGVVLMYDTVDSADTKVISNGKDTIYGYNNTNDRIYIAGVTDGNYQYGLDADNDFIISVGSGANAGTIKLNGIKGKGTDADDNKVIFVDDDGNETEVFVPKYITVGAGETTINSYSYASIVATATSASETIQNSGHDVYISTGAGSDTVKITADVENVSVNAGGGNDTIEAVYGHYQGVVYEFGANDGANWIINASENDSIKYTGGTLDLTSANITTERDDDQNEILVLTLGKTTVSMKGYEGGNTLTFVDTRGEDNKQTIRVPRLLKDAAGNVSNPTLSNALDDYQIIANGGNDTITNSGNRATITASSGNNIIRNTGSEVVIDGGSGNDSITNENANNVLINGGAGNDVIDINSASSSLTVVGGAGNDSINSENNPNGIVYQISSGAGTDSILGFKSTDTIRITDNSAVTALGPDSYNKTTGNLTLRIGNSVLILNGTGIAEGQQVKVFDSTGEQVTNGTTVLKVASVTAGTAYELNTTVSNTDYYVVGTTSADTITNGENTKVSIIAGNGNDDITNGGTYASIIAGAGADTIDNSGGSATIYGGADADSIKNAAANAYILAEAGADTISNTGTASSIYGGVDNDSIYNTGANAYIAGEAGNDTITNTGDNVTIWGGAGNDYLDATSATRSDGVVYKFNAAGEGSDTIVSFDVSHDKLWFSGVTNSNSLPAVSINAGDSSHTFTITAYGNTSIVGTASADLITNNTVNIKAGYGADYTEGNINVVRILENTAYAATLNNPYSNTSDIALNVKGGLKVSNSGVTSITAIGDDANHFTNTAAVASAEANAEQSYVYLTANGGNDTIINGSSSAEGNEGKFAIINAGNGANDITNYAASVRITTGTGADTIANSGSNVSISAGNGDDTIYNAETTSNVSINAGAGADYITITGGENKGGNTVILGGGNDNVYVTKASAENKGNTYVFAGTAAEGTKTITNFSEYDTIRINASWADITASISTLGDDKSGVRITIKSYKNYTYINLIGYNIGSEGSESSGGKAIKIQYNNKSETLKTPGGYVAPVEESEETTPRIAEDPVVALNDLFADDNYMTNDAQISDITAITSDNYSAGNIETFDLTNLTQNNYSPSATYGEDEDKK